MSTNYYILTKDKSLIEKYGLKYELTDEPDWGYWVHICQTSTSIMPLFQAHKNIRDIAAVVRLIREPTVTLYDEYSEVIDVEKFITHCVQFYENNPNIAPRYGTKSSPYGFFKDFRHFDFCESDFC